MLSPGEFYKLVPREPVANVKYRLALLKRAQGDREFQRGVFEVCRQDLIFYINTFVVQYNPTKSPQDRVAPFITWDFQDRALLDRPETTGRKGILWAYEHKRDTVVEKSREMGASWLFLILQDWLAHFFPFSQSLNISKSADAVDCKSPDSLFWKIRFMHEHLPNWLKGEIEETKMFFGFPNRSVTTGVASTGTAGVGGRAAVIFVDEFSKIKEDAEVRASTASTSDCRFFNGTHEGTGTEFYNLTISPEFNKIVMHWTRHPDKNQGLYSYDTEQHKLKYWEYDGQADKIVELRGPKYDYGHDFEFDMSGRPTGGFLPGMRSPWYDMKCGKIGNTSFIARELDIDPKGSVSQFFDPLMIAQLKHMAVEPFWQGDVDFDHQGNFNKLVEVPGGPLKLWCQLDSEGMAPAAPYGGGIDVAGGKGATPSCFSITNGKTGEKILEYANANIEPKDFAALVVSLCRWLTSPGISSPKIVWEHIGPGVNFGKRVIELGYGNIARRIQEDKLGQPRTDAIGFNPAGMGMVTLLREYDSALRRREMMNPSAEALDECLAFRHDGKGGVEHAGAKSRNPEDAGQNHGDRVVADALSWKMCREIGALVNVFKEKDKPAIDPRSMEFRMMLAELEAEEELIWA